MNYKIKNQIGVKAKDEDKRQFKVFQTSHTHLSLFKSVHIFKFEDAKLKFKTKFNDNIKNNYLVENNRFEILCTPLRQF